MPRGQQPNWHPAGALLLAVVLVGPAGCSDDVVAPPNDVGHQPPETMIISAPLEYDTTAIRVHIYWNGTDKDGEVVRFRFAIDEAATEPKEYWQSTTATDSIFEFPVGPVGATKEHRFHVAAEDNQGFIDPTPASRIFSSQTIPPTSCVTKGPFSQVVGTTFAFAWSGTDPDGGETGGPAPVDSFEYMLLRPGTLADSLDPGGHEPLPAYSPSVYLDLIGRATGNTLPPPYDDWRWIGIRGTGKKFEGVAPAEYVFVVRAVDTAGAREAALEIPCNVRRFFATTQNVAPSLTVCLDLLYRCLLPNSGPVDVVRPPLDVMEGETLGFTWHASADYYGGTVAGFTYALDDTGAFPPYDPLLLGTTLSPSQLPAGYHTLYVRVRDVDGNTTNASIPLYVVHPAFKDPGAAREVLYVDDALGPGNTTWRFASYPSDVEETNWWMLTALSHLGVIVTEWDTYYRGITTLEGKKPPGLRDLAQYSTVVWNVDFNTSAGWEQSSGLWKAVVGRAYGELGAYLRSGGTLILTGFSMSAHVVDPNTKLYANWSSGICASLQPGSTAYKYAYFPRTMMGLDGALASDQPYRTLGARDFIAAWPTEAGIAAGYDSAFIDRGPSGSGAKWITNPGLSGDPNLDLAPGLPRIDGWKLADDFACDPNAAMNFRVEDPSRPVAEVIYRYHGVNMGVDESGGPSPREGLPMGIRVQAHDLGNQGGGILSPGAPGVVGRMVHIGIPLYFLRDPDALRIIETSFRYVNESPTLP